MLYTQLYKIPLLLLLFFFPLSVFAENIDPHNDESQYAYGENVGWINAEPLGEGGPGVEVEDANLKGFLWGENIGWLSLSCENTSSCDTVNYGVTNDGNGNLSGYAWGENVGWISFSCENTTSCGRVDYEIIIDPITGEFSGQAWGENIGWTTLRSTGLVLFGVTTSWTEDLCEGDFDHDGDVDGSDVAEYSDDPGGLNLDLFAANFGKINCP